jgi:hypothetical protein
LPHPLSAAVCAEKGAERAILGENGEAELQADVLKVGHHGSKNSTMPDFLTAVRPRVAVISAGEGKPYGHPSPELVKRLEDAGVRILRTDRDGAIHVLTVSGGRCACCGAKLSPKLISLRTDSAELSWRGTGKRGACAALTSYVVQRSETKGDPPRNGSVI